MFDSSQPLRLPRGRRHDSSRCRQNEKANVHSVQHLLVRSVRPPQYSPKGASIDDWGARASGVDRNLDAALKSTEPNHGPRHRIIEVTTPGDARMLQPWLGSI